jgi:hypothetical protein
MECFNQADINLIRAGITDEEAQWVTFTHTFIEEENMQEIRKRRIYTAIFFRITKRIVPLYAQTIEDACKEADDLHHNAKIYAGAIEFAHKEKGQWIINQ